LSTAGLPVIFDRAFYEGRWYSLLSIQSTAGGGVVVLIELAYAQGTQPGGGPGGLFSSLFLFLPLILIFYFLIFRPQQKQRKEAQQMLADLKKGDRVVTRGGLLGVIDKVEESRLRLEVGNGLKLHVQRDYVDRVVKD
jgi:preprotein translocase subunit YajC